MKQLAIARVVLAVAWAVPAQAQGTQELVITRAAARDRKNGARTLMACTVSQSEGVISSSV